MKNILDTFIKSTFGGIFISLGCIANLLSDNKLVGSILFSIGLLSIIYLNQKLYTGSICKLNIINDNNIVELLDILVGNKFGTFLMALIIKSSRLNVTVSNAADVLVNNKNNDSFFSLFLLGMLCELCIFIAVSAKEYQPLFIIFGVTIFVYCGFEHCIADFFYSFVSNSKHFSYILPVLLGNTVCGIILQKLNKYI